MSAKDRRRTWWANEHSQKDSDAKDIKQMSDEVSNKQQQEGERRELREQREQTRGKIVDR